MELTEWIKIFHTIVFLFDTKNGWYRFSCLCKMQQFKMHSFYIDLPHSHDNEPMDLLSFCRDIFKYLSNEIFITTTKSYLLSYRCYCLEANVMKKEYLQKFVVKVSDIIHLAVQFNVVLIVVKIKNMFAQNVI